MVSNRIHYDACDLGFGRDNYDDNIMHYKDAPFMKTACGLQFANHKVEWDNVNCYYCLENKPEGEHENEKKFILPNL